MSQNKTDKNQLSFRDLQVRIEDLKQRRDDLNKKTKEYINSLQEIEIEINSALTLAKDTYKKKRDYWNIKVKKLKEKKIEYKKLLEGLIEERSKFKKTKGSNKGPKIYGSIKSIEKKIENFERMIETDNLDISEENSIVDKIKELAEKKQELLSEQKSDDLFKLERKIEIVNINLNKIYEQLNKWSNKSQDYHLKMLEAFDQVNELREQKKQLEEELIENKKAADDFHERYLEFMNQKKKRNKTSRGGNNRGKKGKNMRGGSYRSAAKSKNEALMEKIKQDKLESALEKQKAGKKLNIFEARLILEQKK